ncbi:MAG TPA: penicillin-binding transpeptidase domain-containing protein [Pyrinomonadaceae bacterium]|nr:penicillin-binding transpeptidase domain-containing protein [Pyrinomonadaceae bacterium]
MRISLGVCFMAALLAAAGCAEGVAGGGPGGPAQSQSQSAPLVPREEASPPPDLSAYFKDRRGTFVLHSLKGGRYERHDAARAAERFTPFSTFKIPNSLIGLETGVIRDADFEIKWDSKKYPAFGDTAPFTSWWQDQTLRTAFRRSVVWYYRELASRVGAEKMKEMVERLDYGNEDTSGGVDRFWLGSTLKISADEQVEFLKRLYKEELPVSKRSMAVVKEIMTLEEGPGYKLSGKTGGGPLAEGRFLGWFVGYLEAKGDTHFFALQLEGPTYVSIRDERIRLTKQILADRSLMPAAK